MSQNLFLTNLLNPVILFFVLGFLIRASGSNFSLPKGLSRFLSLYLVVAIGFKGGACLVESGEMGSQFILASFLGIALSFALPFIAYSILKRTTKIDSKTQAAIAAHYGSVSLVTFITACSFLTIQNIPFAQYMVAVLALMESPAILSGLIVAHNNKSKGEKSSFGKVLKTIAHEIKAEGILLVLLGSFLIGMVTGQPGLEKFSGFLVTPFTGILGFFLFDMGLKVGKEANQLKLFNFPLFSFGLYMPLIGALIALISSKFMGFNVGTTTLMMTLGASASYIAVPAVMQVALPEAKPAIYLPLSLAITFPFNVVFGIPLYYEVAKWFLIL
ncbi:MAG: hypothetical protein S4CHLAM7_07640 [Chlamydiae bacterium]|nr:hypothetical protein [Chlamydiota bacterium]